MIIWSPEVQLLLERRARVESRNKAGQKGSCRLPRLFLMLNTEIQKEQLNHEIWHEWFMLIVNN